MLCFLLCCFVMIDIHLQKVMCDNTTSKYVSMTEYQDRHGRFITFNTKDDSLKVELEFSVPFITIPVRRAWDYATGNVANINLASILITGGMVLVSTVFLPAVLQLIFKKFPSLSPSSSSSNYRSDDLQSSELWRVLNLLDQSLLEHNIDTTSCMQRAVCWTVKNSASKVSNGTASSNDKIIDGIASHELITGFIEGTALEDAVVNGLNQINCAKEYNKCKITQRSIHHLAKQFVKFMSIT